MSKKCIVCEGALKQSKMKGLEVCERCGFVTADLSLSEEEIQKLYSSEYYNGEEYADYLADQEILQRNFRKRLKRLCRYREPDKEQSLFEIGCAYGFFLQVAKERFGSVEGIDISADAVEYARKNLKLNAHSGDYLKFRGDKKYDVICMWDTIEHLERPEQYIEKAYDGLKKDGLLCITTGDIGSLNARLRGRRWRQIHPPTHLHYFSRKTLSLLLAAKGFRVLETSYPANTLSLNTVLYTILCLKSRHERLYGFLKRLGLTNLNIAVNMHDFMFIIARKDEKQ